LLGVFGDERFANREGLVEEGACVAELARSHGDATEPLVGRREVALPVGVAGVFGGERLGHGEGLLEVNAGLRARRALEQYREPRRAVVTDGRRDRRTRAPMSPSRAASAAASRSSA
jgi:hypothetical protein